MVEISPIGLRQELTGLILHDPDGNQADMVRLVSPTTMKLSANTTSKIEGVVRVPSGDAKYLSLGIIVRDIGKQDGPLSPRDNPNKTQAAIRFLTQYVLRIDLEIEGARGEEANRLIVDQIRLVPFEGRPLLQAMIMNPTDTTFELEARARIRSTPQDRSNRPVRLAMPVRSNVQDESRYLGRILPKSRIRMEELLPEAI
ncbi:MAG: hypothetical protein KGQ60_20030, partial [Planctomycetes bacterium]|nr:hypothetical protein [Planctomycetota bacterium]